MTLTPTQPAPALDVATLDGSRFVLADQDPDSFTLLVFYRGLHCPICKDYLANLATKLDEFAERGADRILAVSMDTEDTARRTADEWDIDGVTIGYGLDEESARAWGLFLSKAINDGEPDLFSEPGLFLVRPDGSLYYAAVNSMPFGRPSLSSMVKALDFVHENDYPPRGEVA